LIASVLGMNALDPLAIAGFVALGWAVERRTFIAGITALPGGSVHSLTADGLRSTQHFGSAVLLADRATNASAQGVRAQLVALSSGAARAGGALRCALTAGRDTRVMAALLHAAGLSATYYTGGDPSSLDVLIASELARRLGLAHEVYTPKELARDWTSAASRFVRQNDGLSSLVQLADYIELADPVKELQITFWGVGGEIGRAGTGVLSKVAPNLPIASRLPEVQRRLLALKVDDQGLLTEHGKQLVTGFLNRFVEERLREGWPTREVSEAFYTFERVASWGATGPRRAAGISDLFSPYCTRPFINYCFSLRPSERYLEAPHHRLLMALDRRFLEHRFEQPFRPQHPTIVGMLATLQLFHTARSRQRHGVALPASADVEAPFLDRWLDARADLLQTMSEKAPPSIWELIDRTRFTALLAGSRADRTAYRDTLLRIATPLWWLGQPGDTQRSMQGVTGSS
jgi:asparagine synthase (glutamine-hydrolysing)